jgi:hypothetical protein
MTYGRNSLHDDERLDLEEEGEPDEYHEPHYLDVSGYMRDDPEIDDADPESADHLEWQLDQLLNDIQVLVADLDQSAGAYDPERPSRERAEALAAILSHFGH